MRGGFLLRLSVEGLGYIGPVDAPAGATLADLRHLIAATFDTDSLPPHYVFLADGNAIGSRLESSLLAVRYKPSITLLATPESPLAARVRVTLWTGAAFRMWALPTCTFGQLRSEASRFWHLLPADTVLMDTGGALWPESGRVHESLSGEGGPEAGAPGGRAGPNAPRAVLEEDQPVFRLVLRDRSMEKLMDPSDFLSQGGEAAAAPRVQGGRRSAADASFADEFSGEEAGHEVGAAELLVAATVPAAADGQSPPAVERSPAGAASLRASAEAGLSLTLPLTLQFVHPGLRAAPASAAALGSLGSSEDRLWRMFCWYALAGDAGDPFHLRGRQWRRLLDDAGLLYSGKGEGHGEAGGGVPPVTRQQLSLEQADVVFTTAASDSRRGARQGRVASGRPLSARAESEAAGSSTPASGMDYACCLRALVAVGPLLNAPVSGEGASVPPPLMPVTCHAESVAALSLLLSEPGLTPFQASLAAVGGGGGQGAPAGRVLDGAAVSAFAAVADSLVGPTSGARRWDAAAWTREAQVMGLDGSSMEALVGVGEVPGTGAAGAATTATASANSIEGVLARFVPALRLLFSYYADAPAGGRTTRPAFAAANAEGGKAPPRGYAQLHKGRAGGADAVVEAAADVDEEVEDGASGEGEGDTRSGLIGALVVPSPGKAAMAEYMGRLRADAAAERAAAYASAATATVVAPVAALAPVGPPEAAAGAAGRRNTSRLALQSLGISPNSVSSPVRQAAAKKGAAAAQSGSYLQRAQAAARQRQAAVVPRAVTAPAGSVPSFAAGSVSALLPAEGDWAPAVAPRVRESGEATMTFDAFLKLQAECGLANLGSVGHAPPLSSRATAEAFLAAASSAPGPALLQAVGQGDEPGSATTLAGGAPDPFANRARLTFPQFVACIGRLSVRLGQHALAYNGEEPVAPQAPYSPSHVALLVSCAAVPLPLRIKALLQVLDAGLSQAPKLVPLLMRRRDTLSAGADKLLSGIQTFHSAYTRMAADDGHPDYSYLLVAHATQAASTGALKRAHSAIATALGVAATASEEERGAGTGEDDMAARTALLVEGQALGPGAVGTMLLRRRAVAGAGATAGGQSKRAGAKSRRVLPPIFAADLVRFAGMSPLEAAAAAAEHDALVAASKGGARGAAASPTTALPAGASALAVSVTALADLDGVWREQQAVRAGTAHLMTTRQAEARRASASVATHSAAAREADASALVRSRHGPLAEVHEEEEDGTEERGYVASLVEAEMERRRAVWAQLQAARDLTVAAVRDAVERQRAARSGGTLSPWGLMDSADAVTPAGEKGPSGLAPAAIPSPDGSARHTDSPSTSPRADMALPSLLTFGLERSSSPSAALLLARPSSTTPLPSPGQDRTSWAKGGALLGGQHPSKVTRSASSAATLSALARAPVSDGEPRQSPKEELSPIDSYQSGNSLGLSLEDGGSPAPAPAVGAIGKLEPASSWPFAHEVAPSAAPTAEAAEPGRAGPVLAAPSAPPAVDGGAMPVKAASRHSSSDSTSPSGAVQGFVSSDGEKTAPHVESAASARSKPAAAKPDHSITAVPGGSSSTGSALRAEVPAAGAPVAPATPISTPLTPPFPIVKPPARAPVPLEMTSSIGDLGSGAGGGGRARSGAIDASAKDRKDQQQKGGSVGTTAPPLVTRAPSMEAAPAADEPAPPSPSLAGSTGAAGAGAASMTDSAPKKAAAEAKPAAAPAAPPAPVVVDPRMRDIVDRRLYWKRVLLEGAVFVKYGRSGYPHKRTVWLDADCEALRWRKSGSAVTARNDRSEVILVSEITEVIEGATTPVFARNSKSITTPDACLSLISPSRTLDLEASSKAQKEEWVIALLALKRYRSLI